MTKIISVIITAVILLSLFVPSVYAVYGTDTLLWDVVFSDADGNRIFSPENGNVNSEAHIYNGSDEKDIYVASCTYSPEGEISDVKILTKTLKKGYNTVEIPSVSSNADSRIKSMILNKNMTPIKKRSDFSSEIAKTEIVSFSLEKDDVSYSGIINDKTGVIIIDVPFYASGEGESELLHPDLSLFEENVDVSGGTLSCVSENRDFDNGVKYAVTDDFGNSRIYTAYAKYSVRQYSSDFKDTALSGKITTDKGSATLSATDSSVSVENEKLVFNKTAETDAEVSFTASEGCASVYVTDYKMSFDFQINSISTQNENMSWYMGELHHIVPFKTENGYTLKYKCGAIGALKEIYGIGEFETGKKYNLTYIFSRDDFRGEVYIDGKYKGTLENIYGWEPSGKLSPIIALTAYKEAIINAEFDNLDITYREDADSDKINLHIIGDSITYTYAPNEKNQEGWGAFMERSFDDNVKVTNHAFPGQSSGMTLYGGEPKRHDMSPIWPHLKYNLKEGDYVMISFGWNEGNSINSHYCASPEDFKDHLNIIIEDAKKVGAQVILVTPTLGVDTTTITFRDDNHKWADAMSEIAAEDNSVICLDLHSYLHTNLEPLGAQTVLDKYHIKASHSWDADGVHFAKEGALYNANAIKELLKNSQCQLKNYLKESEEAEKENRLFTIYDANGTAHQGYVNITEKTITVEQVTDLYTGRVISKYYNERSAEDYPPFENAKYVSYIDGVKNEGTLTLTMDAPADVKIGGNDYKVYLQKHIAATVSNFNAGQNLFTATSDRKYPANPDDKNVIVIDPYQHVPGTFGGSRYGSGYLKAVNAVASNPITKFQDLLGECAYNLSYAKNSGRNGIGDTCLRIIKKGSSSLTDPGIYLYEGGSYWGKDKMDISFDFKYTDFNGVGTPMVFQLIGDSKNTPLVKIDVAKNDDESLKIRYVVSGKAATECATVKKGEWVNIRLLLDRSSDKPYKVCVNDVITFETADKYKSDAPVPNEFAINVFRIGTYSTAECTYYLDNIRMTTCQAK